MGGEVSVYEDGQLEANLEQAEAALSVWDAMTTGYNDVVNMVVRPPRAAYGEAALGPAEFAVGGRRVARRDFSLLNARGLLLACSRWVPEPAAEADAAVLYVHGGSSCRLEALQVLPGLLAAGVSVMALDTSGSGHSEGAYVSLGWFESDDVHAAAEYLRAQTGARRVAVWGRSFGAAAALLFAQRARRTLCYSVEFATPGQPFGLHLQPSRRKCDAVVYALNDGHPHADRIRKGDLLVAVGEATVRGRPFEAIVRLLQEAPRPVVLVFERRGTSDDQDDEEAGGEGSARQLVDALVVDSCFSDLKTVAEELVAQAQGQGLLGSSLVVGVALRAVRRSVESTAGFDLHGVRPARAAKDVRVPALFAAGAADEFLPGAHTDRLLQAYGGAAARRVAFAGGHDDGRPPEFVAEATAWVLEQLGVPAAAAAAPPPPDWLRAAAWNMVGGELAQERGAGMGRDGVDVDALPLVAAAVSGHEQRQDITGPFTVYVVAVEREQPLARSRASSVCSLASSASADPEAAVEESKADGGEEEGEGEGEGEEEPRTIRFNVYRRYNEFKAVRSALIEAFPDAMRSAPPFPEGGARAFSSRFHPQRLQQRAEAFSELLAFIVDRTLLREAEAVSKFLHFSQDV